MLRGFYKELTKNRQSSAETSLNLNDGSKNGDEARCVKQNQFRIYDFRFDIDEMSLCV